MSHAKESRERGLDVVLHEDRSLERERGRERRLKGARAESLPTNPCFAAAREPVFRMIDDFHRLFAVNTSRLSSDEAYAYTPIITPFQSGLIAKIQYAETNVRKAKCVASIPRYFSRVITFGYFPSHSAPGKIQRLSRESLRNPWSKVRAQ